jgi:flagellar biosynthesis/type III secretory pathway chaperone
MTADSMSGHFASLKKLIELLNSERGAILKHDGPRLSQIAQEKTGPLKQLAMLLTSINQGRAPDSFTTHKQELMRLLKECDQANRANGALLNLNAARASRMLAPLMIDTSGAYGPKGYGARSASGSNRMVSTLYASV